jgi:hypothetical protein
MAELEQVEQPVETTIVTDSFIHESRKARLEQEEKELEELEKKHIESGRDGSAVPAADAATVEQQEKEEEDSEQKELTKEEKTFKKRYGDLRRHAQKREEELKAEIERLKAGPSGDIRPPAKDEDIEAWARRYPDVASIVETIASKKAKEMFATAEHRLEEYEVAQAQSARLKAENKIREAHPDFDDIKSADKFHDWAEQQPKWVQDAVYENSDDPASVVRVLDLYKVDNGMTPSAKRIKEKQAASNVSKRGKASLDAQSVKGTWKESDIEKMTDQEYFKNAAAIDEAARTGKLIYDITG